MKRLLTALGAMMVTYSVVAYAANTVFLTGIGEQVFPISAPLRDGTAGNMDNMIIGAATPRAATFTTVQSTGGVVPAATTSPRLSMTGNWKPLAITDGTSVTCNITTTYNAELFVPANVTVTGVAIVNAATAAGNATVGLASSAGVPIAAAKSASTAVSGTAAYQRIPFATPFAATGPATYYVQLQCDNATDTFRAHTVGDFGTQSQTAGTYGAFVSFTPAGTFTTAVGPIASLY